MRRIELRKQFRANQTLAALAAIVTGVFVLLLLPTATYLMLGTMLVIAVSLFMMQRSSGLFNLRALTIPALWYWAYLTIVVVPSFFVYADQVEPYRTQYLFSVESALITVPFGVLVINYFLRFRQSETVRYFENPAAPSSVALPSVIAFLVVSAVPVIFAAIHFSEIKTVPLIYLLQHPGDYFALIDLREESFALLESPFTYFYGLTRETLFPFVIVVGFGRFLSSRSGLSFCLFAVSLVAGALYGAMTIEKAPVALILLLLGLYYYLYKSCRVGKAFYVLTPMFFASFPLFVYWRQAPFLSRGIGDAFSQVVERLFYTPAEVLYFYFEVFPDVRPFQHGATIGRFRAILGVTDPQVPTFVGLYMDPYAPKSIHANSGFIGNLHADFGLSGVLVGGVIAGMLMAALQVFLARQRRDAVNLSVYAFSALKFATLCYNPLPVVLLSEGVLVVPALAIILIALERYLLKVGGMSAVGGRPQNLAGGMGPPG